MPSNERHESNNQNGLVYTKQLDEMPDFSNNATRTAEQEASQFEWDDDESQYGDDLVVRGPFELDNGSAYKGQWSRDGVR